MVGFFAGSEALLEGSSQDGSRNMIERNEASPVFLDCTLRDGGYYTNWDFSPTLVDRYLRAVAASGIKLVEVGLRNFARDGFVGPFAYSTEAFLGRLDVPPGVSLGVMVDAKTIFSADMSAADAINELFLPKVESRVELVRVAAHFSEVQECGPLVNALKSLGYKVGVNLMQASGKPADAIGSKLATLLAGEHQPDVLYFADSLGNMDAAEVTRLYNIFRDVWSGPIGIHTHNNQGLAVANSLHAYNIGVAWLDATVQGMGRGAGNAEMEILLTEIGAQYGMCAEALYELAMEDFAELRQRYRWGPSLMYYFSAKHGIHPTYAQELMAEDRYTSAEKVAIIQHLAELSANSFDKNLYTTALIRHFADGAGTWSASRHFEDRDVLFVAAGPTSRQYARDILGFAQSKGAALLTINTLAHMPADAVDGVVSVDQNRIRFEANQLRELAKPVYAPVSCLPDDCQRELSGLDIHDFGLRVSCDHFELSETGCTLPHALSAVYGIALALQGGARHVYLAGFDGYSAGDPRQQEMIDCLEFLRAQSAVDQRITAITPTTYPVKQGSLYAP